MSLKLGFKVSANWELNAFTERKDLKTHRVSIVGKPDLTVSAAREFKGNPQCYNPEDLLLSSLISCHMMSYFYLCDKHKVEILSYSDTAEGILEVNENGSGKFVEVVLFPRVIVKDKHQVALAVELHEKAHELCFIANSCNFEIKVCPTCEIKA